jgi:hypothetical protein
MSNVIEFPYGRISNPHAGKLDVDDHEMEVALEVMKAIIYALGEYRYDARDPELFADLGVVLNLIYAALRRTDGQGHFLHKELSDMADALALMKRVQNDNSRL